MPIIAVCPYCRRGKVRAPDRAVGMSYPCPKCHSNFTLSPSGEAEVAAARSSAAIPPPAPRPAPVVVEDTSPYALATAPDLPPPDPEPELVPDPEPEAPPVRIVVAPAPAAPPAKLTDPGLPWALAAITLAGVGLAASQLPYGRFVTAGLGGVGLIVAGLSVLAADRTRRVPAAACGVNLLAVVLAVAFPTLLGHSGWVPPKVEDKSQLVLSVGHADGDRAPADWVDGSKASWQRDDVRVTVRFATLGPAEVIGPKDQKKWTKEKVLQIGLRVANVGVARQLEFTGWSAAAPAGTAPRLTDAADKPIPAKKFEPGWELVAKPDLKPLFPGKSAEFVLVFEPPPRGTELVRLELPGAALGLEHPVRLQIPTGFIGGRDRQ